MAARKRGNNYKKLILDNGAVLYVLHMSWVKTVGLGVYVGAGARDEVWPAQAGLAHAYEHMTFQGTEEFPDSKSLSGHVEFVGGMLNAQTNSEATFFYNCLPSEEKERGIKVLSQQILRPLLPSGKIVPEMKNIIQEINRANDNPSAFVGETARKILYGDHPLSKKVLGTKESVSSFKREDFLGWRDDFYHTNNFIFAAVGDIGPAEARELFNRYFPEKSSLPVNKRTSQPVSGVGVDFIIQKEIEQAHVILGAVVPGAGSRDSQVLRVFVEMLDGATSFPFFQEIRDKRGLCYAIGAALHPLSDAGTFVVYFGTDPKRVDEAAEAIREVIRQVKNSNFWLEKAKRLTRGRLAFSFDSPARIISSVGAQMTIYGKPLGYNERLERVESVSIEEVESAVDRYLAPEKFVKVALLPKLSPAA